MTIGIGANDYSAKAGGDDMGDYLREYLRRLGLSGMDVDLSPESNGGMPERAIDIAQNLLTPQPAQTEQPDENGTSMLNEAARMDTVQAKNEWTAAEDARKAQEQAAQQAQAQERLAQIQARNNWIQNHDAQTADRDLQYRANAPILSTGELPFVQEQLAAKYMYSMADDPNYQKAKGMTADQIREAATNAANRSRAIAQSAGYNLNDGYGSDVSLERATDNLASNAARARLDILQGKYSQTADQFYDQRYGDLLSQGLSPSLARRLAGQDAQKFQNEQVAYLRDMLGGYGLNGGYLNELGTQIVGMMGNADSAMGNYYAKMYGSPLDAQNRANTVEDTIRSHEFGQENSLMTAYLNEWAAQRGLPRDLTKIRASADYGLRNGLETGRQAEDFRIAAENRANEYEAQRLKQMDAWIDSVFEGDDVKVVKAAARGIKLPQKQGEKISDDSLKNLKALHEMMSKRAQSPKALLDNGDQMKPDPKVLKQYNEVIQQMAQIEETFGDQLNPGVDKATGDYQQDAAALNQLWSAANGNEDTYKQLVDNWLTASGVSGVSRTVYMSKLPIPTKK